MSVPDGAAACAHLHDGCDVEAQDGLRGRQVQRLLQPAPCRLQVVRVVEGPAAEVTPSDARGTGKHEEKQQGVISIAETYDTRFSIFMSDRSQQWIGSRPHRAFHHSSLESWLLWKRRSAVVNC